MKAVLNRAGAWGALLLGVCSLAAQERSDLTDARRGAFQTPVAAKDLDPAAFAEWSDGQMTVPPDAPKSGAELVWTSGQRPRGAYGYTFGKSRSLGVRHLRLGFTRPIPMGAAVTVGDVRLSVLKEGADYPGDPADESQWLAAQRIESGRVTSDEAAGREACALWTLPPGTRSRALRFTHTATAAAEVTGDGLYAGRLGGVYLAPERLANLAPQALAAARNGNEKAGRITNGSLDGYWSGWENISGDSPDALAAARRVDEDPEWVMLAWPEPVTLQGVAFLVPFFGSAEVQRYAGDAGTHPRDAGDAAWATVASASGLRSLYPLGLPLSWLDFGQSVTTRAVRVRLTAPFADGAQVQNPEHGHTKGRSMGGKRVELCELLALRDLGAAPLESALPPAAKGEAPAGVPVTFALPDDGFVTLVVEDASGKRVRNLISETPFKKGANTVWWDATDDLGRDFDAPRHGVYRVPEQPVAPGEYRVRGLWRKALDCRYAFSVYSEGNPPWPTRDHAGAWLANHTPPQSALFLPAAKSPTGEPAVLLGAYITEGPDGLIWVDLDGRKRGGKKWIGGTWTAAPYLARDDGPQSDAAVRCYVASVASVGSKESGRRAELRVTALTDGADRAVLAETFEPSCDACGSELGGVAAYDGVAACALTRRNELWFVDARQGKRLRTVALDQPCGLAFDRAGNLWAISGTRLVCFQAGKNAGAPRVAVASGLEEPVGLTLDDRGDLYVSDRGRSHQVKVFTPAGRLVRTIGRAGAPKAGPYDPLHMNNPAGLAVDAKGQLWVAEEDDLPKRVSVWSADGAFVKAFYGPPKYGGGGSLDPVDKARFYYACESRGTMAFTLDWKAGTSRLESVLFRRDSEEQDEWGKSAPPQTALYWRASGLLSFGRRQRYFTNCFNGNPTGGTQLGVLYREVGGVLRPVAAAGYANGCECFKGEAFKPSWPQGVDLAAKDVWRDNGKNMAFFVWSDANGDGRAQPEEVAFRQGRSGGVTFADDFSLCVAHLGDRALRLRPARFNGCGAPVYDFAEAEVLASGVLPPTSSGGSQALVDPQGNAVVTLGAAPFAASSLCGGRNGVMTWSYPSLWPGLHASHEAPKPELPGELIGTTRLLGGFVNPKGSEVGPLWCVNGNMGNAYLFTSDGLFVATLFEDSRLGDPWQMPVEQRGMSLKGVCPGDEHFWPTIGQTPEGEAYLVYGKDTASLVKVEGLETLRRLPSTTVRVAAADLEKIQAARVAREERRKREQGGGRLTVRLLDAAPKVDGSLDDWTGAPWAEIEKRGVRAYFNSDSKPYDIRGAVAVAGDKLFAAWRTGDKALLANSGEMPVALFKTGGTLELMIGTRAEADPARRAPAAGDLRLLVTQVKGQTRALIYRPVAPGAPADRKVPFSSPSRTFVFDQVQDVSAQVQLASDGKGNYEIAVPLEALGLEPRPGLTIRGDIGVLRGNGVQTLSRLYWSNKATGIVSDIPSEAELQPSLWGVWEFKR